MVKILKNVYNNFEKNYFNETLIPLKNFFNLNQK